MKNIEKLLNSIKEWVDDMQNRGIIDEDGIVREATDENPGNKTEMLKRVFQLIYNK